MSLILEALRKSEAERRRGQTPDLLTETVPVFPTTPTRARDWRVAGSAAAAALIVAALAIAWMRAPAPVPTEAGAARIDTREAADEAGDVATVTAPSLQPPPRSLQPPASLRIATPPSPRPVAASPDDKPSTAASTASPATVAAATTRPATESGSPPTAPSLPSPAAAEPAPPPIAFTSPQLPLRLSDLSSEERRQLPPLKLSMHMWAPDAAHRFVIIDGARANEGDRIGDAMVEAIQPDSVLLEWRGRKIRLPIR